ncbi:hypothetical protein [Aeromonas schubertii]
MKEKESLVRRTFLGSIEIIWAAIFLYLMIFTLNEVFDNVIVDYIKNHAKYITSDSIAIKSLSNDDKATIERLINSGVLLTSNDLLERSIEFYTNVISVLVFTVSAFSIVSFLYIKGSVEDKNSSQIRSAVSAYFETDKGNYLQTLEVVRNEFEGWTDAYDLDKIDKVVEKTDATNEDLKNIKKELDVMISKFEQLRANVDSHIGNHSFDNKEVVKDKEVDPALMEN